MANRSDSETGPENRQQAFRGDLDRAWVERLHAEHATVLWQHRVKMTAPIICLTEARSFWGKWHPETRRLEISRRLILEHEWDIVIEILKHEMAHQMVTEVFKKVDLHGVHFRRACERLGVAAWAARAGGELPATIPRWQNRTLTEQEERLLKRVEKLLALAGSANEHEAALAMQRVRELHTRHSLDRLTGGGDDDPHVYLIICDKKLRVDAVDAGIYALLSEHFAVRVIYTARWHALDLKEYKAVELLGTRCNVAMAEYVVHFLRNQLRLLWQYHCERVGDRSPQARRSYMAGVLAGFRSKLTATSPVAAVAASVTGGAGACRDLLAVCDRELEAFVDRRHPRLSTRRGHAVRHHAGSFEAGRRDGSRLSLHRGIHGRADGRGGALPPRS